MVTKIESSKVRQEKVEKALRHSKEEWERTFNAITDIVTLQTPDMCIVKSNTSGCITLGLPCNKIKGQHCYELFHGSNQPCPGCPLVKQKDVFPLYKRDVP